MRRRMRRCGNEMGAGGVWPFGGGFRSGWRFAPGVVWRPAQVVVTAAGVAGVLRVPVETCEWWSPGAIQRVAGRTIEFERIVANRI